MLLALASTLCLLLWPICLLLWPKHKTQKRLLSSNITCPCHCPWPFSWTFLILIPPPQTNPANRRRAAPPASYDMLDYCHISALSPHSSHAYKTTAQKHTLNKHEVKGRRATWALQGLSTSSFGCSFSSPPPLPLLARIPATNSPASTHDHHHHFQDESAATKNFRSPSRLILSLLHKCLSSSHTTTTTFAPWSTTIHCLPLPPSLASFLPTGCGRSLQS